jgi:glycosyltransferase involved in cell wall biosynthesis
VIDLTVITATVTERAPQFAELYEAMQAQTVRPKWAVMYDMLGEGPAAVRNRLVEAASTEWVFPLDDDDLIDPDHFEIIAQHLSDDVDVVWTLPRVPHDEELEGWLAHEVDVWGMDRQNAIAASAAVRRSVWLAAGGQPSDEANEDHAFWIRVRNASGRFKQVMQTTWTYRLDPVWSHRSRVVTDGVCERG